MTRMLRVVCTAVIVLLPFHVLIRLALRHPLVSFWKEGLIALGILLVLIRMGVGLPRERLRGIPFIALLLFATMAGLWAVARADFTAVYGFAGFSAYMALFLLVVLAFTAEDATRLIWMLIVPAFLVAVGAVMQVLVSPTLWGLTLTYALPGSDHLRASSLLVSPILLAPYLSYAIVLAGGEMLATTRAGRRALLFVMAVVMLFALVYTLSRGGWLQLIVAGTILVLVTAAFGPPRLANMLLQRVALTAVFVVLALPVAFMLMRVEVDTTALISRFTSTIDFTNDLGGNVARIRAWAATWEFIGQSPAGLLIGIGPGDGWFFQNLDRFGQSAYTNWMSGNGLSSVTESYWLLLVLNLGVIGLGLFVYGYGALLLRAVRELPRINDSAEFIRRAALVANLGSAFVALTWLQSLTSVHIAMMVWVQAGILMILTRDNTPVADAAPHSTAPVEAAAGMSLSRWER